jgi:hypothetical protein
VHGYVHHHVAAKNMLVKCYVMVQRQAHVWVNYMQLQGGHSKIACMLPELKSPLAGHAHFVLLLQRAQLP